MNKLKVYHFVVETLHFKTIFDKFYMFYLGWSQIKRNKSVDIEKSEKVLRIFSTFFRTPYVMHLQKNKEKKEINIH